MHNSSRKPGDNAAVNKKGFKNMNTNQKNKLDRIRNARSIRTQITQSLNNNKNKRDSKHGDSGSSLYSRDGGVLKVPEFISSKSYEIKQLAYSMQKSARSSSTRCFQSLPRKMRRRTASHNIKRIPKRLRTRALKEMLKGDQHITKGEKMTKPKTHYSKKNFYKLKMSIKILRLITRSKFMKNALPLKYYQSNLPKNFQLRKVFKVLKNQVKDDKHNVDDSKKMITTCSNNKLGHMDLTGVNRLIKDPLELSQLSKSYKYAKRQLQNVWLPTHVWNSKRSHMMTYYGKKVCYTPTQKCYKQTHRIGNPKSSKSDGCLIEDTCYMGKCIIECTNMQSVVKLFSSKKEHISIKNNCIYFQNGLQKIGCIEKMIWLEKPNKLMLILHPSIYSVFFEKFLQVFHDEIYVLKSVRIQDCQYSVGSINLLGSNALLNVLKCVRSFDISDNNDKENFTTFMKLALNVRDFDILSDNFQMGMNVFDPRLLKNPSLPNNINKYKNCDVNDLIIDLHNNNNNNKNPNNSTVLNNLCDSVKRYESYNGKSTLKELGKRYNKAVGKTFVGDIGKDTAIPVYLYKNNWNGFTLLLPYHWILPFWYQLNKVSRTYHVGLKQIQQLKYETGYFHFPNDDLDTIVGYKNMLLNGQVKYEHWMKKPASKKINYSKLKDVHYQDNLVKIGEIGDPFKSDWFFLKFLKYGLQYIFAKSQASMGNTNSVPLFVKGSTLGIDEKQRIDCASVYDLIVHYKNFTNAVKNDFTKSPIVLASAPVNYDFAQFWTEFPHWQLSVKKIEIVMLNKGHPSDDARLYRISKNNWNTYWKHFLNADCNLESLKNNASIKRVYLPRVQDLVGFASAGTYNLSVGKGTAIGYIECLGDDLEADYCIEYGLLRNVGTNDYKIVKFVDI